MSDVLDVKKLKVTELRDALKARGLDHKGVKADLVKRLEQAQLEQQSADDGPADAAPVLVEDDDTLDNSTTDMSPDASQASQPVTIDDSDTEDGMVTQPQESPAKAEEAPPVLAEEVPEQPSPEPSAEESPAEATSAVEEAEEAKEEEMAQPEEAAKQPEEVAEEAAKQPEEVAEEAAEQPGEAAEQPEEAAESAAAQPEEAKEEMETEPAVNGEPTEQSATEAIEVKDNEESKEEGKAEEKSDDKKARKRSHSPERRPRSHRDRSRSRSRSPHRRHSGSSERHSHHHHHRSPEVKVIEVEENEDWLTSTAVQLDRYNSDLNLRVDEAGVKGTPITAEGFAFMWAGVRGSYGVSKGKVCYEVKILENLKVDHLPSEESNPHVLRVGWSLDSCSTQLGEEKFSYGYGGTGKSSTDCKFQDYGQTFSVDDVIGAYLDYESDPVVLSFTKNGEDLGKCYEITTSELEGKALFPHVLSKNSEFTCNFGQREEPFFPLLEGYTLINSLPEEEDRVRGTVPPAKKEECEMIMMCGLPGCGKTTWALKYAVENPDKKFTILGTNNIIDKMKVMGLPRKRNYSGRWDALIEKATKCLNRMLEIASRKKRNYIIDQTNVYPSAQRRKMRPFEGFQRKAVVIVPSDEEYKRRCAEREKEEGKDVPESAVNEMKANFSLPAEGTMFDKAEFVELDKDEAKKLVEQYNKEGQAAMPPPEKRFRGSREYTSRFSGGHEHGRDSRGPPARYDNRSRGYGDRGGYGDRRGGRGGDRHYGGYMGYSSSDRQRVERTQDNRSNRNASRSYDQNWNKQGGYSQQQQRGWSGQQQRGWSGQQQQGSWGTQQQGSWAQPQQGAYQSGYQWSGYGQGQQQWPQQQQGASGQAYNWNQTTGWSGYQQPQGQNWSGYGGYSGYGSYQQK